MAYENIALQCEEIPASKRECKLSELEPGQAFVHASAYNSEHMTCVVRRVVKYVQKDLRDDCDCAYSCVYSVSMKDATIGWDPCSAKVIRVKIHGPLQWSVDA